MPENRTIILFLILFTFFLPVTLSSQTPVPVEVSKQKIVVEGKVYYMHQVLKGQTLYSISRAYNIPIDLITRENSIPDTGIKEGQMLKIPAAAEAKAKAEAEAKTEVKAKAKEMYVPGTNTQPQPQPQSQPQSQAGKQEEQFIYHRVTRGETLSSIADQYNLSVRDLKKANKGLLFPVEGEYLMIPAKRSVEVKPVFHEPRIMPDIYQDTVHGQLIAADDTVLVDEEKDTIVFSTDRTRITDLRGNMKVAVMLPFFLRENSLRSYTDSSRFDSKGKKIYKEVSLPADYLYEGSIPFIEIYEGILLAADSLRALGLGIELDVYDIEMDTVMVDRLISSGKIDDADLIIGPVFSFNLSRVAQFAAEKNIPVVSPVPLRSQNILENMPTLFRMCPSHAVSQDVMIKEIISRKNSNVVFLYADSLMVDPQTELFWNKLTGEINNNPSDSIALSSYFVLNLEQRSTHQERISSIESLLLPDKENIVIIASTETPVVSSVFSTLHTLEKRYPIKVMGYSEIAFLPTIDLRYYYDMELFTPVESYVDFGSPLTAALTRTYMKKFGTEPTRDSFAWRGFDLAYFFISGIAVEGKSFVKRPWKFNPLLVSHDVRFSRDNRRNGFENIGMYTLQYNKDMSITVTSPEELSWQNKNTSELR